MKKKRVYICNTGGTIGMKPSPNGYQPERGFLAELIGDISEMRHESMPEYVLHEYSPLLDSANMRPSNWLTIAKDIRDQYDQFDGFVVIHGTDTMAYTSSALPFLLQGLDKPVVLTGSQIPLSEIRNDARENLITSMQVAADPTVPEVTICFGDFLLRGCRARKITSNGFDAFQSPNYPPLARIGAQIDLNRSLIRDVQSGGIRLTVEEDQSPQVAAFRLFPGINHEILNNLFRPPLRGIVIEAFGVGNAPSNDAEFLKVIRQATDRGVVVVICTQCNQGRVDLGDYASGRALRKAGAIGGLDMTAEAALAKLYFLLNVYGDDSESVKSDMRKDLVGELSENVE